MRHLTTVLAALSLSLAVGCATDATSPTGPGGGGGGGKADDGTGTSGTWGTESPLEESTAAEQAAMHAADVECMHINRIEQDPYYQSVKLFCLPRGGVAAPLQLFLGVVPTGEAGGAYKIFTIPGFVSEVPQHVDFRNHDVTDPETRTGSLQFDAAGPIGESGTGALGGYHIEVFIDGDPESPDVTALLQTRSN